MTMIDEHLICFDYIQLLLQIQFWHSNGNKKLRLNPETTAKSMEPIKPSLNKN